MIFNSFQQGIDVLKNNWGGGLKRLWGLVWWVRGETLGQNGTHLYTLVDTNLFCSLILFLVIDTVQKHNLSVLWIDHKKNPVIASIELGPKYDFFGSQFGDHL